jgi:hypothetical protein
LVPMGEGVAVSAVKKVVRVQKSKKKIEEEREGEHVSV